MSRRHCWCPSCRPNLRMNCSQFGLRWGSLHHRIPSEPARARRPAPLNRRHCAALSLHPPSVAPVVVFLIRPLSLFAEATEIVYKAGHRHCQAAGLIEFFPMLGGYRNGNKVTYVSWIYLIGSLFSQPSGHLPEPQEAGEKLGKADSSRAEARSE